MIRTLITPHWQQHCECNVIAVDLRLLFCTCCHDARSMCGALPNGIEKSIGSQVSSRRFLQFHMNFRKKIMALALCALGVQMASVRAETHTNLIYNVSIGLRVVQQDFVPVGSNQFFYVFRNSSFGSPNISDALANTPLFKTNHLQGAKLMFRVSDFGSTNNQHPSFILRKGTNDFDMGDYFSFSFPALSVTSKVPGPN